MDSNTLKKLALKAREHSYSPYSHFAVGAVVIAKDGTVFEGANIENSSYPLGICAERSALFNAYLHGYKKDDLVELALVADSDSIVSPCGACRQVMSELLGPKTPVHLFTVKGSEKHTTVEELLPFSFSAENLK